MPIKLQAQLAPPDFQTFLRPWSLWNDRAKDIVEKHFWSLLLYCSSSTIDIKWLVAFMSWRVKYHTEIASSQDVYIAQFDAMQVKHIYFCRLRMELKNLAKQLFREASLKSYLFRQINKGSQKNIHLELFTSHTTI